VRGRLYPADSYNARGVPVWYHENQAKTERHVLAWHQLNDPRLQPYVHDIIVTTVYRRKSYKFRVFLKRHKNLPLSLSIRQLADVDVGGDIMLVACGKKVDIRNMCGRAETRAADQAVRR
ncbi:hypothetical protein K435DRAFT_688532, partial [Dendrothele bispora CBS 962.96]